MPLRRYAFPIYEPSNEATFELNNYLMNYKRILLSLLIVTCLRMAALSQTVENPNYALKSHETLEIRKVEIKSSETTIYMSIENRMTGGYFCADKNTFIVSPDGESLKLSISNGIPVCPDTYRFKMVGERLDFILVFPPIKPGAEWIDLVEECTDYCFSFYRIVLDDRINQQIEEAYELAEKGESSLALDRFIRMAGEVGSDKKGFGGLLHLNIIKLAEETGYKNAASEWYGKLVSSEIPNLELFLNHLNSMGIKY